MVSAQDSQQLPTAFHAAIARQTPKGSLDIATFAAGQPELVCRFGRRLFGVVTVEVDKASGAASTSARMNPATDEVWKPAHPAVAEVSDVLLSARRSAHPVDLVSSNSTTLANTGLLSSSDVCDQLLNAAFVVVIACSQSARVERWTLWTGVLLAGCATVNVLPAELALATLWIRLETTDIGVFRVDDETAQVIREQVDVLHSVQISVANRVE